ncbi:MAG: restriction endonuclease subunit R [Micavibrio sp.]|nr:MAG: restriction endonuclease subunit R [Micavibrio sp.]
MSIQLKNYQVKTLDTLKAYLQAARFKGAEAAYDETEKPGVVNTRPYQALPELPEVPFVCLRLPTGGGKTLLSAHTVRIAAETYLERDFPLVLWLVPSNTIRQQTLETLKTPSNPNYKALHDAFGGQFTVMDITDFTMIRPHDLQSKAVVVVGTVQTIKTEESNKDARKVYAHNENLEPLFTRLPADARDFDKIGETDKIRFSFVNLLRMQRPLVLVDEAHNNSTTLGLELFRRINAACVVEFTATPARNSNVLHSVSAMELKAEEMIKLPIVLTEHSGWEEAVRDSILTRSRLEKTAKDDAQYIRPIVLFQAENKAQDITWQVLKDHLIQNENIPEEKIAVVTGDQRELDGINLFDPNCPIDYVITVQALKEGWDCSFAYVFCSVANIHSAKDVEQILGRVLRMPYAKRRSHEDLNRAYAHVSRVSWPNAVKQLHDRLVSGMGFEEQEAEAGIELRQPGFDLGDSGLFRQPDPLVLHLKEDADIDVFSEEDRQAVTIEKSDGGYKATVTGVISPEIQEKLVKNVPEQDRANTKLEIQIFQRTWERSIAPSNQGEKFSVPQLLLRIDGEIEQPDGFVFQYAGDWKLEGPAALAEHEFSLKEDGKTFAIDIEDGHITHSFVAPAEQLNLDLVDTGWTVNALAGWMDKKLRQPDIPQPQMLEFIRRTIVWLEEERNMPLSAQVRGRFLLYKVLESKINTLRKAAQAKGYQNLLFKDSAAVEVSFDKAFSFAPDAYNPTRLYNGPFRFKKHFYPVIADMNKEEAECAKALEMMDDKVKFWVRNLEKDIRAFRLPLAHGWFYPDFVAMLSDGRILVVEYKGAHLDNAETKAKDLIGKCWQDHSKGKGLYLTAWQADGAGRNVYEQVKAVIENGTGEVRAAI